MISYAEAIAQCAEHIAEHDAHGYSQPNRKGYGTEYLEFSDGTKYSVHYGDYDCSEMARMCCESCGLLSSDDWMWTGNEHELLTGAGFSVVPFDDMVRGCILWKQGHTGIYLGNGLMADAHGDEYGGIDGPNEGDQTGREIEIRDVWSCNWQVCYMPPIGFIGTTDEPRNGVDLSSYDEGISLFDIDCDFAIIKVSEGTDYLNPTRYDFLEQANDKGMLYGMYHYANSNDAYAEAEYFVNAARDTGFINSATLWLDYEGEALDNGPEWAEDFMSKVDELTGKTCGVYMSQNTCITQDWERSKHRPLWVAQYASTEQTGWQDDPWSTWMFGAWGSKCAIHQYSDRGTIGINHEFDLDRGYFSLEQWHGWATGTTPEPQPQPGWNGDILEMKNMQVTFNTTMNVRDAPSLSGNVITHYTDGETNIIDGIVVNEGYIWGHYIGSKSGKDRFVAIGESTFVY